MINLGILPILLLINGALIACLPKKRDMSIIISQLLFIGLIVFTIGAWNSIPPHKIANFNIITYQNISLNIALGFDVLTKVMLLFILLIGFVIYRYAINYLQSDTTRIRFLVQFNLLLFSVSLLAMSYNLLTAFVAWQFIGITLYLLLNHYHFDQAANKAAKKKFVINRLGDCTFLLAIVIAYHSQSSTLFEHLQHNQQSWLICSLIFISVMTKCAQFPFHIWLLDTMETPTPVSAIMHAGIINAGGILLTRISPLLSTQHYLLHYIFFVGLITTLLSSSWINRQLDVKRKLAYSTMGQMGYMLTQCGLSAFPAAVFHLIAHGFFKASLFLNTGEAFHESRPTIINSSYSKISLSLLLAAIVFVPLLLVAQYCSLNIPIFIYGFLFLALVSFIHGSLLQTPKNLWFIMLVALGTASIYLILLGFFTNLLSSYEFNSVISPWLQGGLVVILLLMQCKIWLRPKKTSEYFDDSVEYFFRRYMLDPLRKVGEKLNRIFYYKKPHFILFSVVAIGLIISSFYFHVSQIQQDKSLPYAYILLGLAIAILIAANRSRRLFQLLFWISLFQLCFIVIAINNIDVAVINIGIFHVINIAPVLMMLFILIKDKGQKVAVVSINENILPIRLVYLFIGMLLLIGIPGTASFISEFYLLSHLFSVGVLAVILYLSIIILLSIVIMHALQLYVFNKNYSSLLTLSLSKVYHIIFVTLIGFNVICGLYPGLLLDRLIVRG